MRRSSVDLAAIADWNNLTAAYHRAARGKANRAEIRMFRANTLQGDSRRSARTSSQAIRVPGRCARSRSSIPSRG